VTITNFADLGLAEPLLRALAAENYTTPTPIQAQAIPLLLEGRDLLGLAQTGTGKTAAFALPLLQMLSERKIQAAPRTARALVLVPTRELGLQISTSLKTYGRNLRLTHTVVMGGVGYGPQIKAMARGVDILIATPGRLMDHVGEGYIDLTKTGFFVIDEADMMLDMGFIRDVRKLMKMFPPSRQSILFSATMPGEIAKLADELLNNPVRVQIAAKTVAVERIDQRVHHVTGDGKRQMLADLLDDPAFSKVIVFTRTKRGANRVVEQLERTGVPAEAIHGNKSQAARQKALENFRRGQARVLVATDIASRGIDVDNVSHVINYELPNEPEAYVHRIGRTARAGAEGIAISFCDASERGHLRSIERLIRRSLTVVGEGPTGPEQAPEPRGRRGGNNGGRSFGQGNGGGNGGSRPPQRNAGDAKRGPRDFGDFRDGARSEAAGSGKPRGTRRPRRQYAERVA
jgi:ATP-dependent RNA helicase RhlE